jgi:dipeptidyl aminopeptidase/acylaminoacyl peptidase
MATQRGAYAKTVTALLGGPAMFVAACGAPAPPATHPSPAAHEPAPSSAVAPSDGGAATAAATTAEDQETKTRDLVFCLQRHDFAGASRDFDAGMRFAMPPPSFQTMWSALEKTSGPVKDVEQVDIGQADGYWITVATTRFARGRLGVKVVYDQKGEVAGFFIVPPADKVTWQVPSYVRPASFEERSVSVGAAPSLPGILTVPKTAGPFPAVVLVHGSGRSDADEHVGGVRVFKDLAGSLATRGVVVLRYDKRTLHAPAGIVTEKEEVLDGAAAALELLRHTPGIDTRRLFVIGHSQGGYWAPRIAEASADVAGIVILAGPTRPIQDMLLEQFRYLSSLAPGNTSLAAIAVEAQKFKRILDDRALRADQVVAVPGGGEATGAYFLFERAYDPLATVARIRARVEVLQGERDYQVRVTDFEAWKRALAGKAGAEFHLYPALNHLFVAGTGTPAPAEYEREGHVEEAVVRDIAAFIAPAPAGVAANQFGRMR